MDKLPQNDEDGKLAEIQALANDPSKGIQNANEEISDDAKNVETMQEVVEAALAEHNEDESSSSEKQEQKPEKEVEAKEVSDSEKEDTDPDAKAEKEQTPEEKRISEEVEKRLDQHPRFQELIRAKNELTPLAENAKMDSDFCRQWNIQPEQKAQAMNMLALINSQPEKALEQLETLVENLRLSTGKSLPKDLIAEVEAGTMSKERAIELNQLRLQIEAGKQRSVVAEQMAEQNMQLAVKNAINQTATLIAKQNPDFKPKKVDTDRDGIYELTQDYMKVLAMERYPKTVDEAADLLNRAYAKAKAVFVVPPPPVARKRLAGSSNLSSSTDKTAAPKDGESMVEYVARTVGFKTAAD